MRQADPDHLEELARRLDGDGDSLESRLSEAQTRAARLGVSSTLTPLNPMRSWVSETAPDLRRRAALLRADADPSWLERGHRETYSEWVLRVTGHTVGQLTDDPDLGEQVTDDLGLWFGGLAGLRAAFYSGTGIANLLRRGAYPHAPGTLLSHQASTRAGQMGRYLGPLGRFAGGSNTLAQMYGTYITRGGVLRMPQYSAHANLLRVGVNSGQAATAAGSGALRSFGTGLSTASRTAGWWRGAGVVGSAAGTVVGAANVAARGNPIDAFRDDPAGYSADLAGTAFNASLTAALVAPNPVTIGLAVGTGVAYAGTLAWKHWDEIEEFGGRVKDGVSDAVSNSVDVLEDVGSAIGSGLSSINPFD